MRYINLRFTYLLTLLVTCQFSGANILSYRMHMVTFCLLSLACVRSLPCCCQTSLNKVPQRHRLRLSLNKKTEQKSTLFWRRRKPPSGTVLPRVNVNMFITFSDFLQCFNAVDWATGRATRNGVHTLAVARQTHTQRDAEWHNTFFAH